MPIQQFKVDSLPPTLVADAIYYVGGGSGPFTIVLTNNAAEPISMQAAGQTLRKAQVRNTDSSTNINTTGWTTVPLGGTVDFMDPDFTLIGNGIRCNFAGAVKATHLIGELGGGARTNAIARVAGGGFPTAVAGQSAYIRNSGGHNQSSVSVPGIWADVALDDIITVESFREAGTAAVTMPVGSSYLLLERWA